MKAEMLSIVNRVESLAQEAIEARRKAVLNEDSGLAEDLLHLHDLLTVEAYDLAQYIDRQEAKVEIVKDEAIDLLADEDQSVDHLAQSVGEFTMSAREFIDAMMNQGETASTIAKKTGVGATSINRIWSGHTETPHAKTLRKLEDGFGLVEGSLYG
jgi:uncharacterized protein YerC